MSHYNYWETTEGISSVKKLRQLKEILYENETIKGKEGGTVWKAV